MQQVFNVERQLVRDSSSKITTEEPQTTGLYVLPNAVVTEGEINF